MKRLVELEREIGVTRWTLYRWIKRGKLSASLLPSGQFVVSENEANRLKRDIEALGRLLPSDRANSQDSRGVAGKGHVKV